MPTLDARFKMKTIFKNTLRVTEKVLGVGLVVGLILANIAATGGRRNTLRRSVAAIK